MADKDETNYEHRLLGTSVGVSSIASRIHRVVGTLAEVEELRGEYERWCKHTGRTCTGVQVELLEIGPWEPVPDGEEPA